MNETKRKHPQHDEIQKLLDIVKENGWEIEDVFDGEENIKDDDLETILSVDEAAINIKKDGYSASLSVMLGETPYESVFDYSWQRDMPDELKRHLDKTVNTYYDLGEQ